MTDSASDDFGTLAVVMGFLTEKQREAVCGLQRALAETGVTKRFGEVCLDRKFLTREQLAVILNAQGIRVLVCRRCRESFNVHGFSSTETYHCRECRGDLTLPEKPPSPKVSDSVLLTQTELRTTRRAAPLPISPDLVRKFPGFEILKVIGQGGMGTVFKAREKEGGRTVALKILAPFLSESEQYVKRFFREAKNLQKLDHSNIVRSYGAGEAGDVKYLIMEYVRGATLGRVLKKRGKMPEKLALRITLEVARGLDYAWQHRIIHRDVKPHNIMLGQDQSVKLCDLGLSKELGSDISFSSTNSVPCSPAYASPEQLSGAKDCDCRTDVYSLGVTLYEMVVGELPFQARSMAQFLIRHLQMSPPDPRSKNPSLSPDAGKLILRMMEKSRDQRPEPGEIARVLARHQAKGCVTRRRRRSRGGALPGARRA
jgi:serine/threonine protein kinase